MIWPFLIGPAFPLEFLMAVVTSPVRTASAASVIAATFSSTVASGSAARSAENAWGTEVVGTTATGLDATPIV